VFECGKWKDKVSYADDMVSQRLVAGLINPEHQSRVLGEAKDLPSLKSKIDRLVGLETTDDATMKIRTPMPTKVMAATSPSCAGAMKMSQYKRSQKERGRKRSLSPQSKVFKRRCRGCGRTFHPSGNSLNRNECPAFGKTCDACGMENHFKKVCGKRLSQAGFLKMNDDKTGSEMSEEECSGISLPVLSSFIFKNPA
jgi:hypothetical protein